MFFSKYINSYIIHFTVISLLFMSVSISAVEEVQTQDQEEDTFFDQNRNFPENQDDVEEDDDELDLRCTLSC